MKVGVITFHIAHNYGAVLQAYALSNKLNKLGYDTEIIDYRPKFLTRLYSINPIDKLPDAKSLMSLLLMYPIRYKKYKKFQRFINNKIPLSDDKFRTSKKLAILSSKYDAFITGSDQVWNPEINGVMGEYFLDFVKDASSIKISYAASFGSSAIKDEYVEEITRYLKKLDAISVREEDGVKIVNKLIGSKPVLVLDPVFLLSIDEWKEQIIIPKVNEKYVLVYMMEYNAKVIDIALEIAKEKKLKILNISSSLKVPDGFACNIRDIGPNEFLGYFYAAEYVITNSFHGTAFSIIFEKDFIAVPHTKLNSRIDNILKLTKLKKQQVDLLDVNISYECLARKIDYSKAKLILNKEIESSIAYLQSVLTNNRRS
jgi:hypothetical protein